MKTIHYILLLLAYILQQSVIAQDLDLTPDNRFLDFRIGYKISSIHDQNTSHLIYRANLPMFSARLVREGSRGIFSGLIACGRGPLYPRQFPDRTILFGEQDINDHLITTPVSMQGKLSVLRYSMEYLRNLNSSDGFKTYLGGRLTEEIAYSEGFVTPGLMNTLSFAPAFETQYIGLNRSFLSIGLAIPIVALNSRSAYHNSVSLPETKKLRGFFKNGTNLLSLSQHLDINIYARYFQKIGDHIFGGVEYHFSSLINKVPRTLNKIDHEFNLTFRLTR